MKEEKPIIVYDESDIIDCEVRYRLENKKEFYEDEEKTEEDIRKDVYEDSDILQFAFEDLTQYLTEVMDNISKRNVHKGYWKVSVENFGWRSLDGSKVFCANEGIELLREILPNTDCTFKIFKDGKNGLKIQNFHHDSPTGKEWYFIKPLTKKEYEEHYG